MKGSFCSHLDFVLFELPGVADAREQKELGALDGARREDDLLLGPDPPQPALPLVFHAPDGAATVPVGLHQEPGRLGPEGHPEVPPAPYGAEEAGVAAAPASVPHRP